MALSRDLTTPDNRDYWAFVDETADEVKLWPAWMKGGAVVSRKQAEEVLERVKDELKDEQITQLKADLAKSIDRELGTAKHLLETLKKLTDSGKDLAKFGGHTADCAVVTFSAMKAAFLPTKPECTCGWAKLEKG